jgi:hypothetical protein
VIEQASKVYGALYFEDGTAEILAWDMLEAELNAWHRHPDTFLSEPAWKKQPFQKFTWTLRVFPLLSVDTTLPTAAAT